MLIGSCVSEVASLEPFSYNGQQCRPCRNSQPAEFARNPIAEFQNIERESAGAILFKLQILYPVSKVSYQSPSLSPLLENNMLLDPIRTIGSATLSV